MVKGYRKDSVMRRENDICFAPSLTSTLIPDSPDFSVYLFLYPGDFKFTAHQLVETSCHLWDKTVSTG